MARKWTCGFETGGFEECSSTVAAVGTGTISGSNVSSGAYAYNIAAGGSGGSVLSKAGIGNSASLYTQFRFYLAAGSPAGDGGATISIFWWVTSGSTKAISLQLNTDRTLTITANIGTPITSSIPLVTGTTLIELKIDSAGDTVELKFNGVVVGSGPLNPDFIGAPDVIAFGTFVDPTTGLNMGINCAFDDFVVDDAAYPGGTKIIARQWKATAPTSNGWTKSTGSTIDTVWNDTPISAATSANSGSTTSAIAQTALVSSFSGTQSGHGSDVIAAVDTVKSAKVVATGKTSSTANNGALGAVRQIVGGVTTDANVTITTADVAYESLYFTPSLANLNAAEGGWNKRASSVARTHTVEDVWMTAEYLENPIPQGIM